MVCVISTTFITLFEGKFRLLKLIQTHHLSPILILSNHSKKDLGFFSNSLLSNNCFSLEKHGINHPLEIRMHQGEIIKIPCRWLMFLAWWVGQLQRCFSRAFWSSSTFRWKSVALCRGVGSAFRKRWPHAQARRANVIPPCIFVSERTAHFSRCVVWA